MANSNRTEIYIEGSKEAIDNFVERFDKCHDGAYPNQEENHDLDEYEWDEKVEEEGDSEYDRNFWEEEVDPSFEILQERLDKVMKEI